MMTQKEYAINFLLRETFKIKKYKIDEFLDRAMEEAYLDLNRTLHGIGKASKKEKNIWKHDMKNCILCLIKNLKNVDNQEQFDKLHMEKCNVMVDEIKGPKCEYTHGHAQKWINMTLKNLYIICSVYDCELCEVINEKSKYFHIPVDREMIEIIKNKLGIVYYIGSWSKTEKYEEYAKYQENAREKIWEQEQISPIEWECKYWI